MIWAAERIPPKREYLLFDPQPAIKIPKTQMDVIEATNKMPMFKSFTINFSLKGIVKKAITDGITTKNGASHQINLSARLGTIFSLSRSLKTSAMDCNEPCQPTI